ncbi:MAG: hypothetical protein EXR07_19650 [Acetobacteraceae bacterium]|nr:hypothetical protein [Acetobacteraceae bacterium]
MPAGFELTIGFGANGNSLGYLGGGWARAEEGFTWAVGQESHLLLPLGPEPREFVLTLNATPFVMSPALRGQRLIVSVDETIIGSVTISRPTVLAWRIPMGLIRRGDKTLVTLQHPDGTRPKDISGSTDERELAFSVSEVKLRQMPVAMLGGHPVPEGLSLGGAVSSGFATHPGLDLKEWVTGRTGLTLPDLITRFESLGDNCEFGLVQRRCDTEPLGLLRFSGSFSHDVIRGIEQEFEGIGDPADIVPRLDGDAGHREFMIEERKYGLVYHTFVYEGERTPELMRQQEATRLKFLGRKFLEEMELGDKVFVFKTELPARESEVLPQSSPHFYPVISMS